MTNDIAKILLNPTEIDEICHRLGEEISNDYKNRTPIIIGLLKGCQPFMSDLVKHITSYCKLDYMNVSSYEGTLQGDTIEIISDITTSIDGKDVIIIDDIVDSGRTVKFITSLLKQRGAKSVEVCCLLDKPEGRKVDVDVKYVGGKVPNEFVVGYGLDYNELYRNLPYIGVLKPEKYN